MISKEFPGIRGIVLEGIFLQVLFSCNLKELDHNYKVVHIILVEVVEEVEVEFARIAHEEEEEEATVEHRDSGTIHSKDQST